MQELLDWLEYIIVSKGKFVHIEGQVIVLFATLANDDWWKWHCLRESYQDYLRKNDKNEYHLATIRRVMGMISPEHHTAALWKKYRLNQKGNY